MARQEAIALPDHLEGLRSEPLVRWPLEPQGLAVEEGPGDAGSPRARRLVAVEDLDGLEVRMHEPIEVHGDIDAGS